MSNQVWIGRSAVNQLRRAYGDYVSRPPNKTIDETSSAYFLRLATTLMPYVRNGYPMYFGAFRERKHLRPCISRFNAKLSQLNFVRRRRPTKKAPAPAPRRAAGPRPAPGARYTVTTGQIPRSTRAQVEASIRQARENQRINWAEVARQADTGGRD